MENNNATKLPLIVTSSVSTSMSLSSKHRALEHCHIDGRFSTSNSNMTQILVRPPIAPLQGHPSVVTDVVTELEKSTLNIKADPIVANVVERVKPPSSPRLNNMTMVAAEPCQCCDPNVWIVSTDVQEISTVIDVGPAVLRRHRQLVHEGQCHVLCDRAELQEKTLVHSHSHAKETTIIRLQMERDPAAAEALDST